MLSGLKGKDRAMGLTAQPRVVRFGVYEADLDSHQLRKSGYRLRLQDQPFQVLALLLEKQGQVVTREELKDKLWPGDTFVEFDAGLNTAIKKLRAALSDSADNPRFVETVPRVGYRFVAPASLVDIPAESAVAPPDTPLPDAGPGQSSSTSNPQEAPDEGRSVLRRGLPLLASVVLILLALVLAIRMRVRSAPSEVSPGSIQAIAVLPLHNMSADAAQEYFADGMTDEIITDLARLAGPKVISRTSAMRYKQTQKTVPEIAAELHVGAVVEGSVERSGDRVRVRVQLIQASTDQHLWAQAYDRQLSDILRLEAELAQDIAEQIQIHLTPQQQEAFAQSRTLNPQAFQDYLQGRHYWALRTEESLNKAVDYFNHAIQEDPDDARSYAGLADCYIVLPMVTSAQVAESEQKARSAAQKALKLDGSLAEAHLAIAEIEFYQDWNFAEAEKEFRRTLELNPNYATGHQWYGEFLSVFGRHSEAIREVETALALDPLSGVVHHQAGQSFQQARQYGRAIEEYQKALKLNPDLYVSYEAMYWAYRRQGNFEAAARAMRGAEPYWRPEDGMTPVINQLLDAYTRDGKRGFLRQSIEMHRRSRDGAIYLARDYADLGDRERALEELERLFRQQDQIRLWILSDPELDPLRSEPKFQKLVSQITVPPSTTP